VRAKGPTSANAEYGAWTACILELIFKEEMVTTTTERRSHTAPPLAVKIKRPEITPPRASYTLR